MNRCVNPGNLFKLNAAIEAAAHWWIVSRSAKFATATFKENEEIAAIGDNQHAEETLRRWRAAAHGGQHRSCAASVGEP